MKIYKVKEKKYLTRWLLKLKMWNSQKLLLKLLVALLQPSQTSKMEHFLKIVSGIKLLTIFIKRSILDVSVGSKYTSVFCKYSEVKNFVVFLGGWTFCLLLVARYFLLIARYFLHFAGYFLLVVCHFLLVTFCWLLVTFCSLLITFCSLLVIFCSLLFACCLLFFCPNY